MSLSATDLRQSFTLEDGYYVSPALELTAPVQRAGFLIDLDGVKHDHAPRVEARDAGDESAEAWRVAEITWSEQAVLVARVDLDSDASAVQIRVRAEDVDNISFLQWTAVELDDGEALAPAGSSSEALSVGEAPANVLSRAEWGARATRCTSRDPNKHRITIHHTVTPTTSGGSYEQRLRAIQAFHMDVRNWCDIGYHYLVAADGRTFVGRPPELLGAHVGGANTGNLGVAFVGCFADSGCNDWAPSEPPAEMLAGAVRLLRQAVEQYGIDVTPTTLLGHRDHASAQTDCPGSNLAAKLQAIRNEVTAAEDTAPATPSPTAEDPCGGVTYAGECSGNALRWCDGGSTREVDCAATGRICAWEEGNGWFECVDTTDPCDGLDYFGICEGNVLQWCQSGAKRVYDCGGAGQTCGWQSDTVGNNCL